MVNNKARQKAFDDFHKRLSGSIYGGSEVDLRECTL
jgi:hypothetical protein